MQARNPTYRCVCSFEIAQADDDGALIEDAPTITVPVGKEYEATWPGLNLDVWLRAKDGTWLDLDDETFRECFEGVDDADV